MERGGINKVYDTFTCETSLSGVKNGRFRKVKAYYYSQTSYGYKRCHLRLQLFINHGYNVS